MSKTKELFIEQREKEEIQSSNNATAKIETHNLSHDDYKKMLYEIDDVLSLPKVFNKNWEKRDRIIKIVRKYYNC